MRSAYAIALEETSTVLSVTSLPTLASNWLVPRLGSFQMAYPAYAVRFNTSSEVLDLALAGLDIGIRTGAGDWSGCEAHPIFPLIYMPLCSPALIAEGRLREPQDLLKLPLFGPADRWRWFARLWDRVDLLEREIAEFLGVEDAVTLVSGWMTNASLLGYLLTRSDLIVVDELAHNSIVVGADVSHAKVLSFRHGNLDVLLFDVGKLELDEIFVLAFADIGERQPIFACSFIARNPILRQK